MNPDQATCTEPLEVECYSGYTYAQAPVVFSRCGQRHVVMEVERSWRTPTGPAFRLCTTAGLRWQLQYDEARDAWSGCLLV